MTVYEIVINELSKYGKSEKDVLWVGFPKEYNGDGTRYDRVDLKKIFGFEYKHINDWTNIPYNIVIAGGNWWLVYVDEENYDTGCTDYYWSFYVMPQEPSKIKETTNCETPIICRDFDDCAKNIPVFFCNGCPHKEELETIKENRKETLS